jgi:hypothetical protein
MILLALLAQAATAAPADPRAERELADYADCVVGRDPMFAARVMRTAPASREQANALRNFSLNSSRCLKGSLLSPAKLRGLPLWFRGALFESAYRRKFASLSAAPAGAPPVPKVDRSRLEPKMADEFDYLYAVSACTAQNKRDAAHAFVLAQPQSPAEKDALAAMAPALGACVPEGMKFGLGRALLRATLAEVLYDWSAAPAATASGR